MDLQHQDSSDDDCLIVRKKKTCILQSDDDDDFISSSSKDCTDSIIPDSSDEMDSIARSKRLVTSTPQLNQRDIISESDDEADEVFNPEKADVPFMMHRQPKSIISSDSEDDLEDITTEERRLSEIIISDDSDIIDDSLDIEGSSLKKNALNFPNKKTVEHKKSVVLPSVGKTQRTLDGFVKKSFSCEVTSGDDRKISQNEVVPSSSQNEKIKCKRSEYNQQLESIREYERDMMKTKNYLSTIKLSALPDKGELLKAKFDSCKNNFLSAQERLRKMIVTEEDRQDQQSAKSVLTQNWANLEAGIAAVQPRTFGKKGLENYNTEKALTAERLEQLHGSLKNCPTENEHAEDPKGLRVDLMDHQRRALAWMEYRETQKPSGGILADDMGLGKTLTMISLVLKGKCGRAVEEDTENDESPKKKYQKYRGGTLVVCPASLLQQWSGEIDSKLKRGTLSYYIYHGPKRESKPKRLAEHDIVITTYSIVMHESEKEGAIFRVKWKRLILDEAHQIRNHKSQTSIACCDLSATYRWALTGTPVHNKELDMYALLKFLRCTPFDDLVVWKRWVGEKGSGGGERLHTVISSLMLRRTKVELMANGKLTNMPSRKWELISVTLDADEMSVYQKILIFSQTLFAQFLHQRAEKNQDYVNLRTPNVDPNGEYFKMRQKLLKLNKLKEVNQLEILVLMLRLRQICCHPSLITKMLIGDEDLGEDEPEEREELNLLEQLNKLNLDENPPGDDYNTNLSDKGVGVKEATKGLLNPSHPIFAENRRSSKIRTIMKLIPNILTSGDKLIIVSQWTSYLDLIGMHLKDVGAKFLKLDGSVPTSKRTEIVAMFNDVNSEVKVLLLSLTAGGVGLNLVAANHLFLVDLHWNPQLENQAQDRIYRMGQKKDVFIYKFIVSDTIEERIKKLQDNKLSISEGVMTGSRHAVANKLSLQDLRMIFNM